LRRDPLAVRKATLASLLARAVSGLRFNEHFDEEDGPLVFAHACKLGLEGIVSKRRDSPYRFGGRTPDWIKSKNPEAPAVRREAEECSEECSPTRFATTPASGCQRPFASRRQADRAAPLWE
jgi:ATP-dependent DNA ligase